MLETTTAESLSIFGTAASTEKCAVCFFPCGIGLVSFNFGLLSFSLATPPAV